MASDFPPLQPLHGRCEDGVVSSIGTDYVFVRFTGQHPDADGKACAPELLRRTR